MVAQRIERMEPLLPVMGWKAWGERSCTRSGLSWRLFLVCEKVSARNTRGGEGQEEGNREGGSWRPGELAREMAAVKACLSGGMSAISIRGQSEEVGSKVMSRQQSGVCVCVECRGGVVEGE